MTDTASPGGPNGEHGTRREPWSRKWRGWVIGVVALVAATGAIAGSLASTSTTGDRSASNGLTGGGATGATGATGTTGLTGLTGAGAGSSTTAPSSSTPVASVLSRAYTAERRAKTTYEHVIESLGEVQPFSRIVGAEDQHLATLNLLATRYGVVLPSVQFSSAGVPSTLTAACQTGVSIEQDIVSMYVQLVPQVSSYPDLANAFTNLESAAQDSHLPAFQRCA